MLCFRAQVYNNNQTVTAGYRVYKGPYPLGDLCRIGACIRARICRRWPILAPFLAPIPVGMTLQLGNWSTIAG